MINFDVPNQNSQKRIKRQSGIIISPDSEIETFQESKTEIFDDGDVITTESQYSIILNGERIYHPSQIAGRCQEKNCGQYLTRAKIKYCYRCIKVLCPDCAKWDESLGRWFCHDCYKALKRKRFWAFIKYVLLYFIIEREDR